MATSDSLPVELLIKIWKLTLPSREEALVFGKISLSNGPWALARVSGRWRATMLNTPNMWTDLFISIPANSPSWINYPMGLLKEQLSRAGQQPMRVALFSQEKPGYTTAKIFSTIVQSCARWETLELVSHWLLPPEALRRMRNNIPLLREINICADSDWGYVAENIFEFAPSLQLVRITEPGLLSGTPNTNRPHHPMRGHERACFMWPSDPPFDNVFPWSQLTRYETERTDPFLFDALCLAQNIVVCQVSVVVKPQHSMWRVPIQLVRFTHLQKLTLYAPGPLVDQLVLPALQDFFIEAPPHDFHHIVALVKRSQCSLRKFWMKSHPPPAQYREILVLNPEIVELGIIGRETRHEERVRCNNVDNIIRALRVDAGDVLAPHLRTFYIHDQVIDLNINAALDMVQGRLGVGLQRLCITMSAMRVLPTGVRARLPQLELLGLEVQLRRDDDVEDVVMRGLLDYI
ncbi:hypothetical protein FB451DRAFT_1562206 [Mycena latifolia]|nr:hypothetical protein FB451DRAFT_1562206 [Mycena latifolia]